MAEVNFVLGDGRGEGWTAELGGGMSVGKQEVGVASRRQASERTWAGAAKRVGNMYQWAEPCLLFLPHVQLT